MAQNQFAEFETRMKAAGMTSSAIECFGYNYETLLRGETGLIPEDSIEAVTSVPTLEQIAGTITNDPGLLSQTVVMKLNGGLGTSMGLEKAKSLLQVKDGLNFLDFLARQVLHLRQVHGVQLRFMLMNSFATSADSLSFLERYPELGAPDTLELLQSQVPKIDAATLRPATWPQNPALEWCPPGHGDIYPSLAGSGWLERLLRAGVKYLFVSNSDNLGASLDLTILSYFAQTAAPFMMEVAQRTPSDRKGGHLARRAGKYLLRESAQCPPEETVAFQDIRKHQFFNTNNLWVRLDSLKKAVEDNKGFIPLPLIKNSKSLDPRDNNSPAVIQLETAMGAAIQCFDSTQALLVPRTRFAPVKTTADLLALRSDAYRITDDWRLELAGGNEAQPPDIDLDGDYYKLVDQLDARLRDGVPSLRDCTALKIRGPVQLNSRTRFQGKVSVTNSTHEPRPLQPGEYRDCEIRL